MDNFINACTGWNVHLIYDSTFAFTEQVIQIIFNHLAFPICIKLRGIAMVIIRYTDDISKHFKFIVISFSVFLYKTTFYLRYVSKFT
jgi:hypothetical protein